MRYLWKVEKIKSKKNSNITNLHLKGLREFRIILEHTYK